MSGWAVHLGIGAFWGFVALVALRKDGWIAAARAAVGVAVVMAGLSAAYYTVKPIEEEEPTCRPAGPSIVNDC